MFRTKIETFSIDSDVIRTLLSGTHPLQVIPFLIFKFWFFFDTFVNVGRRVLKCSKIGSRFQFTCEIALNDEVLSQFSPDLSVGMTSKITF